MGSFADPRFASPHKTTDNPVLIIGAGVSGIVNAFELMRLGVPGNKIQILEAQDYVGGRTQTITYGKRSFDTGAHWLHGRENNLFYQWMAREVKGDLKRSLGVRHFRDLFIDDKLQNVWTIGSNGIMDTASTFRAAGRRLTENLYNDFRRDNPGRDISLHDLVRGKGALAQNFARLIAATWMADDAKRISANEYFAEPAGSGGLQVKGGLGRLVDHLASIAQGRGVNIDTGHQVVRVARHRQGVTVDCQTAEGEKSFTATVAYMTPSVGVLQSGTIRHDPLLPDSALSAIDSVQMANLKKVLIPVRGKFFDALPNLAPNTRIDILNGQAPVFVHCRTAGGNTLQILGLDASQDHAESLAKLPLFKDVKYHLKDKPRMVDWKKDPFALGSYSTCKVGEGRLGKNIVVGNLVIGGEAFPRNEDGASTVEGAVWSAISAAEHMAKTLGAHKALDRGDPKPFRAGRGLASLQLVAREELRPM